MELGNGLFITAQVRSEEGGQEWQVPDYLDSGEALCSHTGIVIELVIVSWLFSNSLFLWAPRSSSARDLTWGVGVASQQSFTPQLGKASLWWPL